MMQILHLYMATGKIIALTLWAFSGKVMSLLFNTVSRFVLAFLPRSKDTARKRNYRPTSVMTIDAKIRNRVLANWIQQHTKMIIHHGQVRFNPGMKDGSKPQINTYDAAAAAAKLLQSCPILCDSIDGSPPGSSVPGIFHVNRETEIKFI